MKARVEQLALRFRLPAGAPRVHAQLPSIERALHARLADLISAQLEAIEEGSDEVIVVREAIARVSLRIGEHVRDAAALERVSHAARDAVIALLARPADDDEHVRRFPSDAAYAGAFIVELLAGTAWDRWYFDSFTRFRRADHARTIAALLADADTECMGLFAWLEQRGRFADLLRLVGPTAARALASASSLSTAAAIPPSDLAPLAVATFAIAESLGISIDVASRSELLTEYFRQHTERPEWTDRRALTDWTWRFMRWIAAREPSAAFTVTLSGGPPPALVSLLAERLDWLDGETILGRVASLSQQAPAPRLLVEPGSDQHPLAPRHAAQIRIISQAIDRGSLRLDLRGEPHDQMLLRMLAALHHNDPSAPSRPDQALVAALEAVLRAASTLVDDPPTRPDGNAPIVSGADAQALLRALTRRGTSLAGAHSSIAGIYLLVRPLADLRMERLAEQAGVRWAPLLAALAMKLVGARPPFDDATRVWIGASDVDLTTLEEPGLLALQRLLFHSLADQRHLPTDSAAVASFQWRDEHFVALADATGACWPLVARESTRATEDLLATWRDATAPDLERAVPTRGPTTDLDSLPAVSALSPFVEVCITSIATGVLRAMSRWLPGISGSSAPFLVTNCIARRGAVVATDDDISVTLDRAPLDVVLEMAGCFSPMTSATWLGRAVRFSFARREG